MRHPLLLTLLCLFQPCFMPCMGMATTSRLLVKWHHMLPGRKHTKEAAVWAALERCREVRFSAICLGRPSIGVIEGADIKELKQFVSESGKKGKQLNVIRDEETFDHDPGVISGASKQKKSKPKYFNPTGNKKSEKPDLDGLMELLIERYGKEWANQAVSDLMSG